MINSSFNNMWLNVNRKCNFRCKWCYAEGTKYKAEDDMSFDTAKSLIDLASDIGIKSINIAGGEPTYWDHLFPIIEYIHEKNLMSSLITNGYLLGEDEFLAKIRASSVNSIVISLKAANEEQHKELTGTDGFANVIKGIAEVNKLEGKEAIITYVLSELTVANLKDVAKILAPIGVKKLALCPCGIVFENGVAKKGYALEPDEYVRTIVDNIDEMCEIIDGNVFAVQNTMACIWPKETLSRLIQENKVTNGLCAMVKGEEITFTSKGEIIPCNSMFDYPFGKFSVDFNDAKSFLEFMNGTDIVEFFKKIQTYPKTSCVDCSKGLEHIKCIGGCPLQWLVFDSNSFCSTM